MKLFLFPIITLSMICLTGCTYSITQIHTQGTATDVLDENDTPSLTATIPISGATIPAIPFLNSSITPAK